MTREEAVKMVQAHKFPRPMEEWQRLNNEAIDMAIEALSADTVSREFYEATIKVNHGLVKENSELKEQIESAEPTVIRSKTLMPTKDFKEWAKRVREENPNAIIIPCDAEVVSAELTLQTPQTYGKSINPSNAEVVADLISRAEAIEIACRFADKSYYKEEIEAEFDLLPSADRPSGEWVIVNKGLDIYICDQCGEVEQIQRIPIWDYCPNCGAKMKGESDERK